MNRALRNQLRSLLAQVSREDNLSKSMAATENLLSCVEYKRAQVVMVFLSLPGEIDTSGVVLRAWQEHKRVLAPKVSWEQRRMMPIEIRSLTTDLVESQMGLREPVSGQPIPIGIIDMVLVPGLGFDSQGGRLGRGRGFYEKFLAHPDFSGISCGFAFEEQLIETPTEAPLDHTVAMLVTDKKIRRFGGRSES